MSYLERAITDGHAKLTGEGKQQKILYVAVNHTERYADPEEQVRAEFWAELPQRVAATPRRSRWARRPRSVINQAHHLVGRLTATTRRRRHPLRRGRRSYAHRGVLEREANIIADLPRIYGKPEEYRFYKGDPNNDIQPVSKEALIGAIKKCHQTLWAGGKLSLNCQNPC